MTTPGLLPVTAAPTVVTVLRTAKDLSTGEYTPACVHALMDNIEEHWPKAVPLRRVVVTDTPVGMEGVEEWPLRLDWHGWWSKLELFRPGLQVLGDMLYFDLDTVIVGDLTDIAQRRSSVVMLADFFRPQRLGSGLMYLPAECRPALWEHWYKQPGEWMRRFSGDQQYLNSVWGDAPQRWQTVVPGQVVSYKVHIRDAGLAGPPFGACVVCFHGKPRPWELPVGSWR